MDWNEYESQMQAEEELADYIDTLPFQSVEDYLSSKQFEEDASEWAREQGWREPA